MWWFFVLVPISEAASYPSVTAHGMGDSCFNHGMKKITSLVGSTLDSYAVCVPTGSSRLSDTMNGYFMTMDANVDVFAATVQADANLKDGFNCIGFSQGNMLCRGYVHKYNDPPVKNFLSVHGTVSGVAAFPNCDPDGPMGPVCTQIAKLCGDVAYTQKTQDLLFQIDYYRDPYRVNTTSYKTYSQLAQWNNEGLSFNETYKDNFVKLEKLIMIKADDDTMVFPNEGEHWGHYKDDSLTDVLTMRETDWYLDDMFGLKTLDEKDKIIFNETSGNHLDFSDAQLVWWISNYFVDAPDAAAAAAVGGLSVQ
ncbi:hypothetical protein CTAYLR_002235 [Chrysophaeum taylorii]|uniref:Palmitoyl-protein thioesterase 1 n=1 Tax=Chrysophaeum taylorii TaxID=2483200 RepID=A0AAD7UPL9_9STRA|nr:hypothetical protein CTAYLR_002235 [Chrysophaeum taylorii]